MPAACASFTEASITLHSSLKQHGDDQWYAWYAHHWTTIGAFLARHTFILRRHKHLSVVIAVTCLKILTVEQETSGSYSPPLLVYQLRSFTHLWSSHIVDVWNPAPPEMPKTFNICGIDKSLIESWQKHFNIFQPYKKRQKKTVPATIFPSFSAQ